MKYLFLLPCFCLVISLTSCNTKMHAVVETTSPGNTVSVSVEGHRSMVFDPFTTHIRVSAFKQKGSIKFEITASDLTSENVFFKWSGENHCIITIQEENKGLRTFSLFADETRVSLSEI